MMPRPNADHLTLRYLMISYLKWCGLTEAEVSVYRGVGAVTGLLATLAYPTLRNLTGVTLLFRLGKI